MLRLFIMQSPIKSMRERWVESEKHLSAVQVTHIAGRITCVLICAIFAAAAISAYFGQGDLASVQAITRVVQASPITDIAERDREALSLKANVNLVMVPVTVTDRQGRLVMGLEKDNFAIYDRRDQQVIRYLSNEDAPVSLGIIFDTSSSMYGKLERSREAVIRFLRSANPDDEFFLIGFANRPELLVDFTNSVDEIQGQIARASPDGGTALLDAVYLGLDTMRRARHERKVLLIVSDGADNHSRYTIKEVWPVVTEAEVQIYAMGIFDDAPRTRAERMGPDLLAAITAITGGRTLPIRNLKKIGDATRELSIELRNRYLIAYSPRDLAHDGKWHKITVRVTPSNKNSRLRVYAKGGYYAPAQ